MEGNVITNRRKAVQKIRDLKDRVIFNYGIDNRIRNLHDDVKNIYEDAYIQNRNLYEEKNNQIVSEIKKASTNFIMDIEEICEKYLEDFEPKEYINKVNRYLASGKMPETDEQESSDSATQETSEINIVEGILTAALSSLLIAGDIIDGVLGLGGDFDKDRAIAYIESVFDKLLPKDISNLISEEVETMVSNIKKLFLEEFLQPIDEKLQERMNELSENAQKVVEAEQKINNLLSQSKALKEQVAEMKMLAQNI